MYLVFRTEHGVSGSSYDWQTRERQRIKETGKQERLKQRTKSFMSMSRLISIE